MLHQNEEKSKQENEGQQRTEKEGQQRFMGAMKTLRIAALLWQSNIRKESRKQGDEKDGSKRSAYKLFKMLLLLVFQGENLFRFLSSDKGETACSKNSYYRFLEDCHANWNRFVMLLAARVITYFSGLTRPERVKMLVLDDSVIPRERSKKTELLSHVYDHVRGKTVKGFNLLALGWTDAFSFVPVGFRMLASAKAWAKSHQDDFKDVPTHIISFDTIHDPKQLAVNTRDLNSTVRSDPELCDLFLKASAKAGVPCKKGIVPLFGGSTDSAAFTQGGFCSIGITGLNHVLEDYYVKRLFDR